MYRYTKMKTATNIYIFNLALADALVTTTMPFQSTDYLLNSWPFGEVVCKVFISIDYYNMFTSIFTLTMMSVDRYVAVCHPVKALDFRTPIKAKMINVCIWILSSAAGIPALLLGGTQTTNGEIYTNTHTHDCTDTHNYTHTHTLNTATRKCLQRQISQEVSRNCLITEWSGPLSCFICPQRSVEEPSKMRNASHIFSGNLCFSSNAESFVSLS